MRCSIFLIAISSLALAVPASATVLSVVETDDGLWIGADGLRGNGTASPDTACKVHETPFGIVAKASAIQGFTVKGHDYSLDQELKLIIDQSESAAIFRSSLATRYDNDIWSQLGYLLGASLDSMSQVKNAIYDVPMPPKTTNEQFRQVLLITREGNGIVMRQLMVAPASVRKGSGFKYYVQTLNWHVIDQTVLRQEDLPHPSLHQFAHTSLVSQSDAWIREHPEETLRFLLTEGHRQAPKDVGPPYSIAHIQIDNAKTAGKLGLRVTWVQRGKCPSWNFSMYNLGEQKINSYR